MSLNYVPVRLNTLRKKGIIYFDVYISLGERYVHYFRNAEEIDHDRVERLKSKGVRKLFILEQEESLYLKYLEDGLNALGDAKVPAKEKGALANDTMVTVAENAEKNLESEAMFNNSKKQFEKVVEFLVSENGAMSNMLTAAGISLDNHQHAATVSTLSVAVAMKAGIKNSKDLFELGLAGLLHDIGKNKFTFNHMRPKAEFTEAERAEYKKHPRNAVDILSGKPFISPKILALVMDHEELKDGRGFPDKKNLERLDKTQEIFNMVNAFDRYCFETNKLPQDAFKEFQTTFIGDFDLKYLSSLKEALAKP